MNAKGRYARALRIDNYYVNFLVRYLTSYASSTGNSFSQASIIDIEGLLWFFYTLLSLGRGSATSGMISCGVNLKPDQGSKYRKIMLAVLLAFSSWGLQRLKNESVLKGWRQSPTIERKLFSLIQGLSIFADFARFSHSVAFLWYGIFPSFVHRVFDARPQKTSAPPPVYSPVEVYVKRRALLWEAVKDILPLLLTLLPHMRDILIIFLGGRVREITESVGGLNNNGGGLRALATVGRFRDTRSDKVQVTTCSVCDCVSGSMHHTSKCEAGHAYCYICTRLLLLHRDGKSCHLCQ